MRAFPIPGRYVVNIFALVKTRANVSIRSRSTYPACWPFRRAPVPYPIVVTRLIVNVIYSTPRLFTNTAPIVPRFGGVCPRGTYDRRTITARGRRTIAAFRLIYDVAPGTRPAPYRWKRRLPMRKRFLRPVSWPI